MEGCKVKCWDVRVCLSKGYVQCYSSITTYVHSEVISNHTIARCSHIKNRDGPRGKVFRGPCMECCPGVVHMSAGAKL